MLITNLCFFTYILVLCGYEDISECSDSQFCNFEYEYYGHCKDCGADCKHGLTVKGKGECKAKCEGEYLYGRHVFLYL